MVTRVRTRLTRRAHRARCPKTALAGLTESPGRSKLAVWYARCGSHPSARRDHIDSVTVLENAVMDSTNPLSALTSLGFGGLAVLGVIIYVVWRFFLGG